MKIHQRDVVEVNYLFPNGITKPHMAIVISNDDLQAAEESHILERHTKLGTDTRQGING